MTAGSKTALDGTAQTTLEEEAESMKRSMQPAAPMRPRLRFVVRHAAVVTAVATCIALVACTSTGRRGAVQGAAGGAAAGALGGLLTAAIFGGNVGDSMARGAAWGATTGAVSGAVAGDQAESYANSRTQARQHARERASQEAEIARVRAQLGDDNFRGLEALVDCKHDAAIAYARTAARSSNRDYAITGLWLEALSELDRGRLREARGRYSEIVKRDNEFSSTGQVERTMNDTRLGLGEIRTEFGLPTSCATS